MILGVITDFLHKPYNSIEDPLDLWFHNLTSGSVVPAFSVGYSVGMAKSMATLGILYAVERLGLADEELLSIGAELAAVLALKAMCDPGTNMEDQVEKSISKKFRVTDRPRPHVIQLHTAFSKVVQHKRASGDKRPESQLLAMAIKDFNKRQTTKNRVSSDERDSILNLNMQTVEFRQMLAEHWQAFPVGFSAVPVSLLAKPWHNDSFEPHVKKATHPRMYEALSSNKEKREMWLKRVIGKYVKNLKDYKAAGKAVNIRSIGGTLRKEVDEELVRHCTCLFTAWLPQFRSSLSPQGMLELEDRFYRAALDRELSEKVKSCDESLGIADWRFLTIMSEFAAKATTTEDARMEDVTMEKMQADLKYDLTLLKKEENMWSTYQTQHRLFNAETHNAQVEEREAVCTLWQQYADDHIRVHFPVVGLKRQADVPATITSMVDNYAEQSGVPKSTVFKVYVVNFTFLGSSYEKHLSDCVSIVRDKMLNDPERTCALFIAPNTGPYKQTYDEAAAEKARREVFDTLRDDSNEFCVADVTVFFDPATMWSKTRRTKHEIFLCTSSRRDLTGSLRSLFASSSLVVRQSLSAWVTSLPRSDHVDPTARISVERGNLSTCKERAQWITGDNLYATVARDLWANMTVSSQDRACWIDLVGYDHFLAVTIMGRVGSPDAGAPKEMCGTVVWTYTKGEGKNVEDFLIHRISAKLRSKCEEKKYHLPGAPDLSVTISAKSVFVKPTYNEKDFVISKPLADNTLPLLNSVVLKWMCSNVPVSIQDKFKAEIVTHNVSFNKSGRNYEPVATGKRPAPDSAVGDEAVELRQPADGPKTVDEISKLHTTLLEKAFEAENVKFLSSTEGDLYVVVLEDGVFSRMKPLAFLPGEYLVGQQVESAINEGSDLFHWQMKSDEFMASFSCDPALEKPFSSDIVPLHNFLHFLESNGKINCKIECHTYKRSSSTSPESASDRQSSYTVLISDKCAFRIRASASDKTPLKNFWAGVTPSAVKDSEHLQMVMRLKFVGDVKNLQPQRPGVYFKKDMRLRKGTIVKLM